MPRAFNTWHVAMPEEPAPIVQTLPTAAERTIGWPAKYRPRGYPKVNA
jgi:hypothetical protein